MMVPERCFGAGWDLGILGEGMREPARAPASIPPRDRGGPGPRAPGGADWGCAGCCSAVNGAAQGWAQEFLLEQPHLRVLSSPGDIPSCQAAPVPSAPGSMQRGHW